MFIGGVADNFNLSRLPFTSQMHPHFLGCIKALIVNEAIQDLLQAGNGKSGTHHLLVATVYWNYQTNIYHLPV